MQQKGLHLTWVWRKRGSGSPESLCKFASFAPVRAAVEAPPAPSPGTLSTSFVDKNLIFDYTQLPNLKS